MARFGYPKLPLYWSEPDRRFAFIIKCDGHVAGFVLVTRGSPVTEDPGTFEVAVFFVIRQYRHGGVGRRAAQLLWNQLPGKWTVRVSKGKRSALSFWRRAVAYVTSGSVAEFERRGTPNSWLVLAFEINPGMRRWSQLDARLIATRGGSNLLELSVGVRNSKGAKRQTCVRQYWPALARVFLPVPSGSARCHEFTNPNERVQHDV